MTISERKKLLKDWLKSCPCPIDYDVVLKRIAVLWIIAIIIFLIFLGINYEVQR